MKSEAALTIFVIIIAFLLIAYQSANNIVSNNETQLKECQMQCKELGHEYFDSTPERFFGFMKKDCKCRTGNNTIVDVI